MNEPLRKIYKDGKKEYTGDFYSQYPNRRQRRIYLQKQARNPLFGLNAGAKNIQIVPVVEKEENVIRKLGVYLGMVKGKKRFTGKIKAIIH